MTSHLETYRIPAGMRVSLNLRAYPMDPRFVDDPSLHVHLVSPFSFFFGEMKNLSTCLETMS